MLLACAAFCSLPAVAQDGLGVQQLFDARFKSNANSTVVYMKGRAIREYGLTLFSLFIFFSC